MALETGTYINSLNASNPAATDALAQADDHLRLLKSTIKATLPNVSGAVTATHTVMNAKFAEPVSAITSDGNVPALASGITGAEIRTLIGAEVSGAATASEASAAAGVASATAATLLLVYPVGSVYTSVVATSPATHFGGTWVVFGTGRVMVGYDNSQTEFDTVEKTGGSNTHTLTIAEMPAHTHSISIENTRGDGSDGAEDGTSSFDSTDTNSTGGGTAHPILQPYVVVHMWKRTA